MGTDGLNWFERICGWLAGVWEKDDGWMDDINGLMDLSGIQTNERANRDNCAD
jgi:hypothetical protein